MNDAGDFGGEFARSKRSVRRRQADGRQALARPDSTALCGIAVMAKASAPGRTKTRLVPPLTHEQAAAVNTAFLQDAGDNILLAGHHASIAGYVAYAPAASENFFRGILPPEIGLIEACLPSLGECLIYTIEQLFARGHHSAIVLNADSPTLPNGLLIEAAEILAQPGERAVIGPADDGGYYLLGLKTLHGRLFEDVAWSTARVAAQTRDRALEIKLDMHALPPWYDVDDLESLRRLYRQISQPYTPTLSPDPRVPRHPLATAALMRKLWPQGEFPGGHEQSVAAAGNVSISDLV